MHVEVQHAVAEGVQEVGVMRNDEARLVVFLQERRKVLDTCMVEIVCRLVEQEQVWLLNECARKKKARLLPARERRELLVVVCV